MAFHSNVLSEVKYLKHILLSMSSSYNWITLTQYITLVINKHHIIYKYVEFEDTKGVIINS